MNYTITQEDIFLLRALADGYVRHHGIGAVESGATATIADLMGRLTAQANAAKEAPPATIVEEQKESPDGTE